MHEFVLIAFFVIILLYSIILHEVFHGVAALWLGDPTAKYAGRITFNPIKHIDLWWTIIIPIAMILITPFLIGRTFAFGGAKPVPYNPYNLRNQRWGPAAVAFAGPGINIFIALIFAIAGRFINISSELKGEIINDMIFTNWSALAANIHESLGAIFFAIFSIIIFWNVLLAFFNLIPIPPLDGSKIMYFLLSLKTETVIQLERYGFFILLLVLMFLPAILFLYIGFFWNLFFYLSI
jgi:Zn-dependent protease